MYPSTFDLQGVYEDLKVDFDNLNCVMLETQRFYFDWIEESDLHYSETDKYAQGQVIKDSSHCTGLYGLLPEVKRWHVDRVLEGWKPGDVKITGVEVFNPPAKDYAVVVFRVEGAGLLELHQRLSLLNHINTYPEYKAHVTICYCKPEAANKIKSKLEGMAGSTIETYGINYGDIQ